ncbi:glutathione S-transferase [Massilia sp. KIM]|uniref:glutathione S-transferase family protein n=1 Tax=Massilia sp. KIM TaxID=1955422 RepID=UPI00098E9A60|nr:glutathione binding-like protein [Massilia sp. KIM]OON62506.1 glutathione S-transferase [Massilia sp. KIM]
MYTLYYKPGACSLAVHIVLEWVNAEYKAVRVNKADQDYLSINPAGAVPALDIGNGVILTQCSAILQFLARQYPEAALDAHPDAQSEAQLARWAAFLTGDLHPAFFPVFMPERYTTDTSEIALKNVKAAGLLLVEKKLRIIDQHLQGRDYFLGSRRTYADAYSVPMVRWAKSLLPGGLARFSNIERHHEQLTKDKTIVQVMKDEGIYDR